MICKISKFFLGLLVLWIRAFIADSHGRLINPPSRTSAWRFLSGFPAYYDDTSLYCGGFNTQWITNGGRCGICGEAWNKPKDFEKGGKNYRGTIVATYSKNSPIKAIVEITAGHKGYFEFRICNVDGWEGDATNACFRQNPLKDADGFTRFKYKDGNNTYLLKPPQDFFCKHCVLQWKYHTGNSWGSFNRKLGGCVGCGPQEEFYGCADISIQ